MLQVQIEKQKEQLSHIECLVSTGKYNETMTTDVTSNEISADSIS